MLKGIGYSVFELSLLGIEFYLNLFLLLPLLLAKKKPILYGLSLTSLMFVAFSIYFIVDFDEYLLAETTSRAAITFFLNHGFFVFISIMFWYFSKYKNEKSEKVVLQEEKRQLQIEVQEITEESSGVNENILIKSKHALIKIVIDEILYVESLHKYIKVVTENKSYTTLYSISALLEELPQSKFHRCHRSFILNVSKISSVDGNIAHISKYEIPISKGNKEELVKRMGKQIG
ncbi:MAG: DNA-binding LytR/AlgR family response regulator [Flavobacteriaceae bacterium]|jgi:DNA-binding LytR/AlgR family response regulator